MYIVQPCMLIVYSCQRYDIISTQTKKANKYVNMVCEKYKLFYNIVLSQVISECGEFLFVGTNFGDILVFRYIPYKVTMHIYAGAGLTISIQPSHPQHTTN